VSPAPSAGKPEPITQQLHSARPTAPGRVGTPGCGAAAWKPSVLITSHLSNFWPRTKGRSRCLHASTPRNEAMGRATKSERVRYKSAGMKILEKQMAKASTRENSELPHFHVRHEAETVSPVRRAGRRCQPMAACGAGIA